MDELDEASQGAGRGRWILLIVGLAFVCVIASGIYALWRTRGPVPDSIVHVADVSSERLLGLGSVVGFAADHETHAWLGIPYARPPVGTLRWRAPREPEAWADTFDALAFGPPCVQLSSDFGGVASDDPDGLAGSEDCLYLNVWAPRSEPDGVATYGARLPVMVWIHGGGNRLGHSGSPLYDGSKLAGMENVVVVSFGYRLGPFGWFSHPVLRRSADDVLEASGNFGTLDQIRALEWVQSHIAEFGGDPENVTIFGESAGGTNVLALLLSDAARGLFHRAIAQSGSTRSISRVEAEHDVDAEIPGHRHSSAEIVVSLLEEAGIVPDREAARGYADGMLDDDLLDFLRDRSPREIVDVYRDPARPGDLDVPSLIRDGALLPVGDWLGAFRAGRFNRVPLILGSNRDEMKLFLSRDEDLVRRRLGLLYRIRDADDYDRRARYHSDSWTLRAVVDPASAISHSGFGDVFAYRFDWDALPKFLGTDLSRLLGAAHGFEIPFVFGNFDLGASYLARVLYDEESRPEREALSVDVMSYWSEFARHGRPGRGRRGDLPEWEPWSRRDAGDAGRTNDPRATVMVLDSPEDGGVRLAEAALSRDQLIAAVDAESDLGQAEKCALFLDLFLGSPDWDMDAYRGIGRRGCAEYPPSETLR